jgi:hypothetical protein
MANEFVARKGLISSGSINVSGSVTASGDIRIQKQPLQDAIVVAGRGGGTSDYQVTISPDTLSANRTLTLANGATTLVAGTMVPTTRTITITGTADQIISSAGAQTLGSNRTWTLSLPQSIGTGSRVTFGDVTASFFNGDGSQLTNLPSATVPAGTVSSSTQVASLLPDGTVSSSAQYPGWVTASSQIDVFTTIGGTTLATTGSNTFVGNQIISGAIGIGIVPTDRKLDIDGGEVRIGQSASGTGAWLSVNLTNNTTASAAARLSLRSSASDLEDIPTTQPNLILSRGSDTLGTLVKFTNQRSGFAGIGAIATADNLHNLRFYAGSGSEYMRLAPTDSATLHVQGNVSASSFTGSFQGNGSQLTNISNSALPAGIVSSSAQVKPLLPVGTVTSSAQFPGWVTASSQIDYNSIQNKLSGVVSSSAQVVPLLPNGTVSSSGQVTITATTGYSTFSSSISTVDTEQTLRINNLASLTSSYAINSTIQSQLAGVVSSSTQIKPLLPGGTVTSSAQFPGWVTSSAQIDYNSIQNKLSGVVSSSAQVKPLLPGGTVSSSAQVDYNSIQNKLSGVVSSSTQVQPLLPAGTVSASSQFTVTSFTNGADNRVLTATSTTAITGESNLTFDGNVFAVNTNHLYVSGGNVGIGTASPGAYGRLAVLSGTSPATAYFDNTAQSAYSATSFFTGATLVLRTGANATGNATGIRFASGVNGSLEGVFALVQNAGATGDFVWQGYNGSAYAERMRLTASGSLGIGTASPISPLHVFSSGVPELFLEKSNTFAVRVGVNSSNIGYFGSTNATPVQIQTNSSARMYFDTSGNVGIGTTTPNAKLSVSGSANITGSLDVSGAFTAQTKSFKIQHPTIPEKQLVYGSLESPYHGVRLTGEGVILNGEECVIHLPDYIKGLCKQEGAQVQLTNVMHGKVLWIQELSVNDNYFIVACDRGMFDTRQYKFYWSFTGIRKDVEPLQTVV